MHFRSVRELFTACQSTIVHLVERSGHGDNARPPAFFKTTTLGNKTNHEAFFRGEGVFLWACAKHKTPPSLLRGLAHTRHWSTLSRSPHQNNDTHKAHTLVKHILFNVHHTTHAQTEVERAARGSKKVTKGELGRRERRDDLLSTDTQLDLQRAIVL